MINKNRQGKVNHKRVQRIMHELGIIGIQGKNSKYHSYKGDNGIEKSEAGVVLDAIGCTLLDTHLDTDGYQIDSNGNLLD